MFVLLANPAGIEPVNLMCTFSKGSYGADDFPAMVRFLQVHTVIFMQNSII
jgi:hypothetical protein